jgi:competence protein ComEA
MKGKTITRTLKTVLMILAVSFIMSSLSFAEKNDNKSPININQATVKELSALPGIAKKKAEAIIAYREKNGKFSAIEDIKKVEGIGKDIFEKIKDHIVLE